MWRDLALIAVVAGEVVSFKEENGEDTRSLGCLKILLRSQV